MRYLSQLARETTARVSASRQPRWLRPVGLVAKDEFEFVPPATSATSVLPRGEGSRSVHSDAGESLAEPRRQDRNVSDASGLPSAKTRTPLGDRAVQATAASLNFDAPAAAQPTPRMRRSADEQERTELESSSAGLLPEHGQFEPDTPPRAETTLQSVLAELARRQEELERQRRDTQREVTAVDPGARRSGSQRPAWEAASKEAVRVSIGSIVVQVEPDQVHPAPQPRQRPPRAAHENSDRWARSFLDR